MALGSFGFAVEESASPPRETLAPVFRDGVQQHPRHTDAYPKL